MAMRESVKTLGMYFGLSAVGALMGAGDAFKAPERTGADVVAGVIALGFAVAYFYVGLRLKKLLSESPRTITSVLYAALGLAVLFSLIDFLVGNNVKGGAILLAVLLLTWYLLRNVKRLSAEMQSAKPTVP